MHTHAVIIQSRHRMSFIIHFFIVESFLFRKKQNKKNPENKKVFQSHTGGVWAGGGLSVHPAPAPSSCGFGSNKGCGVMTPKIKMGVCVCIGRRGVQKQWRVVGTPLPVILPPYSHSWQSPKLLILPSHLLAFPLLELLVNGII